MDDLPATSRAVVFDPDRATAEVREFPLREPAEREVLVRITLGAICGSDLHTLSGRRRPKGPIILGHETCGVVARLGRDVTTDGAGRPLTVGNRVTWSIAAHCGQCFFCGVGLPQKCETLFKYGHESIDVEPPLNGGFAEHVYLVPGTTVLRVPDDLEDREVVFVNCSLATMTAAVRLAELRAGEAVLIQGAGLVGLCAAALAAAEGARAVAVVDPSPARLALARAFGATHVLEPGDPDDDRLRGQLSEIAGPRGFDVAIEACGVPAVLAAGIDGLRIGGRYVLAGCVFPDTRAQLDLHRVTTRLLRIIGLHNYTPADLEAALAFVAGPGRRFAFDRVVARVYDLDRFDEAIDTSRRNKDILRVAIAPQP